MSRVTSLLFSIGPEDETDLIMGRINEYLSLHRYNGLVSLEDRKLPNCWYGGDQHLEADVYVGAFNFFELDRFVEMLKAIDVEWQYPQCVQIIIQGPDDMAFSIINVFQQNGL